MLVKLVDIQPVHGQHPQGEPTELQLFARHGADDITNECNDPAFTKQALLNICGVWQTAWSWALRSE